MNDLCQQLKTKILLKIQIYIVEIMKTRLTSHFGTDNQAISPQQRLESQLQSNASFTILPHMSSNTNQPNQLQQLWDNNEPGSQLHNKSDLNRNDDGVQLLSPRNVSLNRDRSEPRLVMPNIYIPNSTHGRKQSAAYTDALPFPRRADKKHSPPGSIYSLRDQVKVCTIINKRFKDLIKRNNAGKGSQKEMDFGVQKLQSTKKRVKADIRLSQEEGIETPVHIGSGGASKAILDIGHNQSTAHHKNSKLAQHQQMQDSYEIGLPRTTSHELLENRLSQNTTKHRDSESKKLFSQPKQSSLTHQTERRIETNNAVTHNNSQNHFNKQARATSMVGTTTDETFNPDTNYQTTNTTPAPPDRGSRMMNFQKKLVNQRDQFNITGGIQSTITETKASAGLMTKYNGNMLDSPSISPRSKAMKKIPSRRDFLRAIGETSTAGELVDKFKNRFALKKKIREEQKAKLMVGNPGAYQYPDETFYQRNLSKQNGLANKNFVEHISNNIGHMQGMIYVNDYNAKKKTQRLAKLDPVKDYVKNFSELHEVLDSTAVAEETNVFGFAKALQQKMQTNKVKIDVKNALFSKLTQHKTNRQVVSGEVTEEESKKKAEDLPVTSMFNRTLEEETKTISNIARNFVQKQNYTAKYKQRELITDRHGEIDDPRIKYFKKCLQEQDLALPILDKIYKKTLCLNDYNLSDGNCQGLASACELFDHQVVNRVLFNNCGITGDQFAMILEGLQKLKDFKSIIYKMNTLNKLSLEKLVPVFEKRLPHHLEELKIIDCKVNSTLISQLMNSLLTKSQLRSFSLVKVHHSPESFDLVTRYVEESEHLREIDLSWNIIQPSFWLKFMIMISRNRTLTDLTLAFNQLLEDQNWKLSPQDRREGVEEVKLSKKNLKVMDNFKDFVKYNLNLIHLDLQSAGLMAPAVKHFGFLLTRAQSLRCLHLCGNDGVTEETITWLQKRIKGKPPIIANNIIPLKKTGTKPPTPAVIKAQSLEEAKVVAVEEEKKQDVFKLFGVNNATNAPSTKQNDAFKVVDPKLQWKEIRNGLKLRNIFQSKRMNELGLRSGIKESKLVIQRHLGYKSMIPNRGQWELLTKQKDECWQCGQHILTLFIWTPRIGQLTSLKDPKVIRHYRDQMEALCADDDFLPTFYTTPRIASQFNGWHYQNMREIVPFCEDNDLDPPDFLQLAINEGKVLENDLALMEVNVKFKVKVEKAVEDRKNQYYQENWSRLIMKIIKFKNPLVANAHMMTNITNQIDPDQKIYFHIDWVRPGRHTFLVQHDNDDIQMNDGNEEKKEKPAAMGGMAALFGLRTPIEPPKPKLAVLKKSTLSFYVHDMLATFRTDPIPAFFKERHVHVIEHNVHKGKIIFKEVTQDVLDNLRVSLEKDVGWIEMKEITNDDEKEQKILHKHTQINYAMISEIYHWLQSRSKIYPWIDNYTFREAFIKQLNILDAATFNMAKFEVLMAQAKFSTRFEGKLDRRYVNEPNGICRFMFLELLFRISKFLYSTTETETHEQTRKAMGKANTDVENVKVSQAFHMFAKQKITPFYKAMNISQNAFREDKLKQLDIEIVYTMNEKALRQIYTKKALENRDTKLKPHNADWMILEDCHSLFREDCNIMMSYQMINEAFGMSQTNIANEFERGAEQEYYKLSFIEFLEFLARVAELYFADSEMAELDLNNKLEYLLDEILPLVKAKRVKQTTVIEEFSESDDDY